MNGFKKISGRGTKEIYYAELTVSAEVFANEWDKRILLAILEKLRKTFDFELYAFCILNDRIRLLTGGLRLKASTLRHMLATLLERYVWKTEQIGEYDMGMYDPDRRGAGCDRRASVYSSVSVIGRLRTDSRRLLVDQFQQLPRTVLLADGGCRSRDAGPGETGPPGGAQPA